MIERYHQPEASYRCARGENMKRVLLARQLDTTWEK
jgi:hypothetical protein